MGGEIKRRSVGSLQVGNYVIIDGAACTVSGTQTSRPGKHGHAKVRLDAVGIVDGRKRQIVMPGHDEIEVPVIDKRNAQVLNISGDTANVMDSETYETFDLKIPDELKGEISEGIVGTTPAVLVGLSKVGVGVTGRGDEAGGGVASIDSGKTSPASLPRAGAKVTIRATAPTTKSKTPIATME